MRYTRFAKGLGGSYREGVMTRRQSSTPACVTLRDADSKQSLNMRPESMAEATDVAKLFLEAAGQQPIDQMTVKDVQALESLVQHANAYLRKIRRYREVKGT